MSREIDRDESPASGDDMSGWKGPAKEPKIPKITDNRNFPKLVVKNSYQPLANVEEKMDTASPASTSTTTPPKEKTPPPITIHGLAENYKRQMRLRAIVGSNFTIKFTRKNTTIYTTSKVNWNKIQDSLKQAFTLLHIERKKHMHLFYEGCAKIRRNCKYKKA
jgi:hypothetical protein